MQAATYSIVDNNDAILDGLTGLCLADAEQALTRALNNGADAYIQDDEPSEIQQRMNSRLTANPLLVNVIAKYAKKRWTSVEVKNAVGIGFCQPKFYTPTAWRRTKSLMDELVCPLGLAFPHDLGRGKGKYSTDFDISDVAREVQRLISPFG